MAHTPLVSPRKDSPQWHSVLNPKFPDHSSKPRSYPQRQNKTLRILLLATIAGILLATLWPLNPFPRNRVDWLQGANGISFDGPGLVLSKSSLVADHRSQSCSLELLIQPANTESVYTILEFYDPAGKKGLTVRQWQEGLVISHDVLDTRGKFRTEKVDLVRVLQRRRPLLLTITSDSNGIVAYFNGDQPRRYPKFVISPEEFSGQIVMGTSAEDSMPWAGEVQGSAIYSSALTPEKVRQHYDNWITRPINAPDVDHAIALYPFSEGSGRDIHSAVRSAPNLLMPATYRVPFKRMLKSPIDEFQATWTYFSDLLSNIAGFLPFGFLLCAYLRTSRSPKHAISQAILAGAFLSFVIEVCQFYIPPRGSGITDVLTNTTGTVLGAILAQSFLGRIIIQKLMGTDSTRHC